MTNNPIKYNDPSGHAQASDGYEDHDNECDSDDKGCNSLKMKIEGKKQLKFCLQHPNYPECAVPKLDSLNPLPIKYDFIAPWEFDKLDAWGFRLNGTYCRIVCFDVSVDMLGNSTLREATFFITPSGPSSLFGWGFDGSVGIVGAYDAPDMESLTGAGRSFSVNLTSSLGGQASYGISASPNVTRNYAQTWSFALSGGEEFSAAQSAGYSFPIFTLDEKKFYKGLK